MKVSGRVIQVIRPDERSGYPGFLLGDAPPHKALIIVERLDAEDERSLWNQLLGIFSVRHRAIYAYHIASSICLHERGEVASFEMEPYKSGSPWLVEVERTYIG